MILATIFGGIGLILAVIFWGVKSGGGCNGRISKQQLEEETRIIQEIYQGLTRMEERIEALETLLLEKRKSEQNGKDTSYA